MNQNTVTGDIIALKLRQLQTKDIRMIRSNMYFVDFELDDGTKVSYVFNITKGDKFFLQRMRPYAIVHGKFGTADEIVDFIRKDIAMFRNAVKSSNFPACIKTFQAGSEVSRQIERLFLTHNTDPQKLEEIYDVLQVIIARISDLNESSERIEIK